MSILQTTILSKPQSGERVDPAAFAYMRSRAKRRAYDLVMGEFARAGITKAELARRLGKGADRVSRMLGGPGNWTLATVSDLLFAVSGSEPNFSVGYPLDKPKRNFSGQAIVEDDSSEESPTTKIVVNARLDERDERHEMNFTLGEVNAVENPTLSSSMENKVHLDVRQ